MSVLFSFSLELQKASEAYTINSTKIETISFYSFIFILIVANTQIHFVCVLKAFSSVYLQYDSNK